MDTRVLNRCYTVFTNLTSTTGSHWTSCQEPVEVLILLLVLVVLLLVVLEYQ